YRSIGTSGYPQRSEIDAVKDHLWKAICTLRDVMAGAGFGEPLRENFNSCFPVDAMRTFLEDSGFDIVAYVKEYTAHLDALESALAEVFKQQHESFPAP